MPPFSDAMTPLQQYGRTLPMAAGRKPSLYSGRTARARRPFYVLYLR